MEDKLIHTIQPKAYERTIQRKYRNYRWILYFSIGGLSFMFISLTLRYFISSIYKPSTILSLNPLFYWNTLILSASSCAVELAKYHFRKDHFRNYKTALLSALGLGILFLFGQAMGCILLFGSDFTFNHPSAAYLYVISGFHAGHIIGGLIFLSFFLSESWKMLTDYAISVVYFTDPVAFSQLKLFAIFWHFLGFSWMYLLFFFLLIK
ncbi:MAG: cytochrome c oxidase subunit III [Sphingobacteriales bacterium]|nr:cytochrome c oxidase subunit III [Sphingobacteriales bacterium]